MTHETQNVACQHAIAARTALEAFRHQQPEAGLDWSSFDTAVGLLDQTIEELRRPVRGLEPTLLAAGGFPAAMAYLIEEIQAADGPDMEFCQHAIETQMSLRSGNERPSASRKNRSPTPAATARANGYSWS